jgi:hypothetical protein
MAAQGISLLRMGAVMLNVIKAILLTSVLAVTLFPQQTPDRLQAPERLFLHPQDQPEIIPPEVLADRDPVRVDPQHFKLDLDNEQVRVVHLSMKGSESTPMHEETELLAVCIKECHVRLSRPDGKFQDVHMQAGDARWVWEETRSEKNLSKEPLDMLLIEIRMKHAAPN